MKRKICAEDHCRVVEGDEECHDKIVETAIEVDVFKNPIGKYQKNTRTEIPILKMKTQLSGA